MEFSRSPKKRLSFFSFLPMNAALAAWLRNRLSRNLWIDYWQRESLEKLLKELESK